MGVLWPGIATGIMYQLIPSKDWKRKDIEKAVKIAAKRNKKPYMGQ
jgi:hypothetical protein